MRHARRGAAGVAVAILAALSPIVVALQGATLAYVVSIERRLTRLETLQGIAPGAHQIPPATPATRT